MTLMRLLFVIFLVHAVTASRETSARVLDKQKQLESQTIWVNHYDVSDCRATSTMCFC